MSATFLDSKDFLDLVYGRDEEADNVETIYVTTDGGTVFPVLVYTDRVPQHWSSFDDRTIVFDAYTKALEDTLQSSKTLCYGYKLRDCPLLDSTRPALPRQLMSLLVAKAKDKAFDVIKQYRSPTLARAARHAEVKAQTYKDRTHDRKQLDVTFPNFGRK